MDDEQRIPNQAANQEPAEGSRETVNEESSSEERDRFDNSDTRSRSEQAGGITNRPLDEEIANQREVPPRGDVKVPGRDHA